MDSFTFDDEYLRRLRERDRNTTDHFVSYFGELLQITLRPKVASAEVVDDLRQEIFYRVFKKLDELREGSKLGSFVFSFRNKVLLEHYRNEAKSKRPDALPPDEDWSDAAQELIREESAERVRALLAILKPRRDAEILRELFLNEKDKDEVCEQFSLTRENLRVVVHRALKRFKNLFERDDDEPPDPL
jgi:RNA polymerase sigma-70 factor, ECF subfamily